jgi:TonB family protein
MAISVFDPSGKLLRTGTGVLVSNDGEVLTSRALMEGGAHAVVKTPDNRIFNVRGILTDSQSDDLAVIDTDIQNQASHVSPSRDTGVDENERVVVSQSPLSRSKPPITEGRIGKVHKDAKAQWFELSMLLPSEASGAPIVDSHGRFVGLVTRAPGNLPLVGRAAATLDAFLARIPEQGKTRWLAEQTPPSPAEGPLRKIPLAQSPQGGRSKLIYSPAPAYPSAARSATGGVKGTGRFRLTFDANGQVKNVVILRSTQNGLLDQAAVTALRRWKAAPGEEWTLNVPITFQ